MSEQSVISKQSFILKKLSYVFSAPLLYLAIILFGVFSGISDIQVLKITGLVISEVFIKIFKCISLPIISLSIIVTLASYHSDGMLKSVWRKTICYTLLTTITAAFVSYLLYIAIQPELVNSKAPLVINNANFLSDSNYFKHLSNLVPSTIFTPFLEHQIFSVLLLSIIFGIAIRFIPEPDAKKTIIQFFRGAHSLFMVITKWVITIIPIGLYGFITTMVTQLHNVALKGIGEYLLIIVLANLIQGFIILPLWLKYKGIAPFDAMKKMSGALSLAFFSKSSVGALPVAMDSIEKKLNVPSSISRFVLPLCTSINMNGCAAFIFTTVIYIMQNNGIHLSPISMGIWVIVASIAAIGNAGVPMGCFFLSTSLLASMNVPITLLGIILPFYSLLDMLETSLNVWSDICVTKVVALEVEQEELLDNETCQEA